MSGLVDAVRAKVSPKCLARKCSRDGCGVSLKDAPESRLIIDFDKPCSPLGMQATRCDYLFIAESVDRSGDRSGWIAPLELQKGGLDASKVVKQLQAGARAAEKLVPRKKPVKFRPVAAFDGIHKAERNKLRSKNTKVRFHGHTELIRLIRCDAPLVQALTNRS